MWLRRISFGVCLFFCWGYFYSPIFADTVVLKSGQVVEGKIIENNAKYVKIDFEGVELIYFQEEVASINQGKANYAASKEWSSIYEAFKASNKAEENKKLLGESACQIDSVVNQKTPDVVNTGSLPAPQTPEKIDPSALVESLISNLPKEQQDAVKSKIQNMQGSSKTGQASEVVVQDISSWPEEYKDMIKSGLKKTPPNTEEAKK